MHSSVKEYAAQRQGYARYSPPACVACHHAVQVGQPERQHINTSFVERRNLTMRMSMRRFTRLTNAFSRKIENHCHAIALHSFNYNFVRKHQTIMTTPAVMVGVADREWTMLDFVKMLEREEELLGGQFRRFALRLQRDPRRLLALPSPPQRAVRALLEYRAFPSGTQVQYKLKLRPCVAATFLRPRLPIAKEFRFDDHPDDLVILDAGQTYSPNHAFAVPRDFTLLRDGEAVTDFSAPHVAALKVEDAIARTAEAAERLTELVGRVMTGARASDLPVDTSALAVFLDRVPWTPFFYPEENRTFACPPPDAKRPDLDVILAEEAPRLQAVLETAHRVARALPAPKRRRNGSSRGRGRPPAADRDPDFDRRVYEAMLDGGTTYDELARSWGHKVEQLRLGRDRHRKALEKIAPKGDVK